MANILILLDQAPLPLQANGLTLRLNPVLRHLSRSHEVDLLVLGDRRPDAGELVRQCGGMCRQASYAARREVGRPRRLTRTFKALLDPERAPWEVLDPFADGYLDTVRTTIESRRYDAVLASGWAKDLLSRFLEHPALAGASTTIDWVDSPSLHHARETRGLTGWAQRRARSRTATLIRWQRRLNARVDAAIYIADADRGHAGEHHNPKVHVLANGVLDGARERPPPDPSRPPTIGFLGNMSYRPNVEAALRLHRQIFLPLRGGIPGLELRIVGRQPSEEIRALSSDDVEVTGAVPSIWPELATIDLMVFPMEIGGGLQNKVLEAVAAGCGVVVTPVGAAGTGDVGRSALEIAETDREVRERVQQLLEDPAALEASVLRAQEMLAHFSWEAILPRYEAVVMGEGRA